MRKILLLLLLFVLSACTQETAKVEKDSEKVEPTFDLEEYEYAYSLDEVIIEPAYGAPEEATINELMKDEKYISKVYGDVETIESEQHLVEYITERLTEYDKRVGILYTDEKFPATIIEETYKYLMNSNDSISATLLWYTYAIEKVENGVFIDLYNETTTNKIELATINKEMDRFIAELNLEGLSDLEKVEKIYTFVMDQMEYVNGGLPKHHSPLGFVIEGEGVCQAYAVSMYMLFERAGIESRYIIGDIHPELLADGEDGAHAWNMVKLDGNWYHLDATWDDGKEEWENFLVSDTWMSFTRSWEKEYYERATEPY